MHRRTRSCCASATTSKTPVFNFTAALCSGQVCITMRLFLLGPLTRRPGHRRRRRRSILHSSCPRLVSRPHIHGYKPNHCYYYCCSGISLCTRRHVHVLSLPYHHQPALLHAPAGTWTGMEAASPRSPPSSCSTAPAATFNSSGAECVFGEVHACSTSCG